MERYRVFHLTIKRIICALGCCVKKKILPPTFSTSLILYKSKYAIDMSECYEIYPSFFRVLLFSVYLSRDVSSKNVRCRISRISCERVKGVMNRIWTFFYSNFICK